MRHFEAERFTTRHLAFRRDDKVEPGVGVEPTYTMSCSGAETSAALLNQFRQFMEVDRQYRPLTVLGHMKRVRWFLRDVGKPISKVTVQDVRTYLAKFNGEKPRSYRNRLNALVVFFRDYLKRADLIESFRYPEIPFEPNSVPKTEEVRRFYEALDGLKARTFYLIAATSGLRKIELMSLTRQNVDLNSRMLMPKMWRGTKNTWITFYNGEAQAMLHNYLETRTDHNPKLFPWDNTEYAKVWKAAQTKTDLKITPQKLRDWFCQRLGELGVPDRFVDAFCGRVPKSVLARHYTDYEPSKLKVIYDRAGLRVFE